LESTRSLFNRLHVRCTAQREALYEALRESSAHPTAEELYHLARSRVDRLSLATVYNTLDLLCEAGLARKLPTDNGCCRYDADTSEHLHVRFRETCEIEDVPEPLGRRLLENLPRDVLAEIEHELGLSIDGVSIQLVASRPDSG
jgi:Fe2+ or Zn2+ uptake regulation protein